MSSSAIDQPRNSITQDGFLSWVIQKGIPIHFSITHCGDSVTRESRVIATLILKIPYRERREARYYVLSHTGHGKTMGHALQALYDFVDMNVI